jgi:hypothetical protein
MKAYFDHEKLNAYQLSLALNESVGEFLSSVEANAAAKDQLIAPRQAFRSILLKGMESFPRKIAPDLSISRAGQPSSQQRALMSWFRVS